MTVYFVTRRHRGNPWCIQCHRFNADTVLDWFRSLWELVPAAPTEQDQEAAWDVVHRTYPGMAKVFNFIFEERWEPPRTMADLFPFLEHALWQGGETLIGSHHLQVPGNPDDWEKAIYVFDDHYVAEHPDRAAVLIRDEGWLPDGAASGGFRPTDPVTRLGEGEESIYLCFLTGYDSACSSECYPYLGEDGTWQMAGARLDNLAPRLFAFARSGATWFGSFQALHDGLWQAVRKLGRGDQAEFHDDGSLLDLGLALMPVGVTPIPTKDEPDNLDRRDPSLDERRVQQHVAQALVHMDADSGGSTNFPAPGALYHQWILFDDHWAAAFPDLANSLLRLASRWDVL